MQEILSQALLRIDANWVAWAVILGALGTTGLGFLGTLLKVGGIVVVEAWIGRLEEPLLGEARREIIDGLNDLKKGTTEERGCDRLLIGLDKRRTCQNRSRRRIRQLLWAALSAAALLVFVGTAYVARAFEMAAPHEVSGYAALGALVVTIPFAIFGAELVLVCVRTGLPRRTESAPALE